MGIAEFAEGVGVLNDNGRPNKLLQKEKCNSLQQGNSKEYRIAKLKRDYPEIADRL